MKRLIFLLVLLSLLYGCGEKGDMVRYEGRAFPKAELSQETIEWLEWFNALPEEEQEKVNFVPPELRGNARVETVDAQEKETE